MPVTLNLQNAPADNKLPVGTYDGEVITAEVASSASGNQYVEVRIRLTTDGFVGRQISKRLWITPAAMGYTRRMLQTILGYSLPDEDGFEFDEEELIGCAVRFKVVHKPSQDGETQYAEIAGFMAATDAVSETAAEKSTVTASRTKRANPKGFLNDDE